MLEDASGLDDFASGMTRRSIFRRCVNQLSIGAAGPSRDLCSPMTIACEHLDGRRQ
jgi:hypothetical protein